MKMLMTTAALIALTTAAGADTLRFGYAENATPTVEAMKEFARLLEEKTGGGLTVQFFPDGQLGGERELVELVQGGLLDMTKVSGGLMESFAPVYGAFSMPYLFDDEAHYYKALDDAAVMAPVYQATADQGMVGLTYYNSGARSFYTKDKPINSPADLAGLKIRVLQSPTSIRMVEMLGASPIAMSQAEVYTSIQQGVLDGAENNEFALTVARHAEVAKAYSYDMHTRIPDILLISTAALDRLTPEQRDAVNAAARESTAFHRQAWTAAVDAARAEAETSFGVTFTHPEVTAFQEAVKPMYDEMPDAIAPTVNAIRAAK
ncbi:TRAP transporter substrate-binding protein [Falsirhodobacter sp. 1013]|uniref:TRAP transporter substrate-binding protein n=1 Tax=Falsirhodobacter sp. 1013 TaxID=3417566 RepID=UPI003EBAB6CF